MVISVANWPNIRPQNFCPARFHKKDQEKKVANFFLKFIFLHFSPLVQARYQHSNFFSVLKFAQKNVFLISKFPYKVNTEGPDSFLSQPPNFCAGLARNFRQKLATITF
jgi:hypothetical protein